jgi:alkanesulfonate monooxygenase SsuD/methylene tetrahydromethanopterin reductase-like flavin-dependent oxidoreductase (luciferase family)
MRVGLTLANGSGSVRHALQEAVLAERAGVETIYVLERHFDPDAGYANAFAVAAALSGRLEHAWIAVQPAIGLEHPLRIVEQSNMLDTLTRGRCTVVISDDVDAQQYEAFGLPVPHNGLFGDLVLHMEQAWAWQFQEDGPPLEFSSGAFEARMAGRIMPSAYRSPRPLLAREARTAEEVSEAARYGWTLQLRNAHQPRDLVALYLQELSSSGLPRSTVETLRERITMYVEGTPEPAQIREMAACGVAEIRVSAESLESVLEMRNKL